MRRGWKMLAAVLGGAMLVCSGYEGAPVKAEENTQQEAEKPTISKATDLKWNEKGQGIFTNPNGTCEVKAYVYGPDGRKMTFDPKGLIPGGEIKFDLYHLMNESGTYTFEVYLKNDGGSSTSERSAAFEYVKPDTQLPVPVVSVTKEGIVSCTLPESEGTKYSLGTDYGFYYGLAVLSNGQMRAVGNPIGMDKSTFDFSKQIQPGGKYFVTVRTLSRDIMKYLDSDWTDMIPVNPEASGEGEAQPTGWEPSEEEMKLYAACGKEEINFTADAGNAYEVTIENSMQGMLCFASFEAVLEDYTIGRTYTIFPSESGQVSQMDEKVKITMTIPETLQAEGRTFRMISVTEGGKPVVLEDLDSNAETITFETNTYYAYALIYRDAAKGKVKTR